MKQLMVFCLVGLVLPVEAAVVFKSPSPVAQEVNIRRDVTGAGKNLQRERCVLVRENVRSLNMPMVASHLNMKVGPAYQDDNQHVVKTASAVMDVETYCRF